MVGLKQDKHKRLSKFIDVEKHFNFRPYASLLKVAEAELYSDLGDTNVQISTDVVPMISFLQLFFPLLLSQR